MSWSPLHMGQRAPASSYARVPARLSTPLPLYCLSQGFLSFRANQYLHLDPSQDLFEYSVSEEAE